MTAISIHNLEKVYDNGFKALKNVDLSVKKGEIFALLGPNGAGKTTLINAICGIVKPTAGTIEVFGHDTMQDYRKTRRYIGLVPQEIAVDSFITVWNTVAFSRRLFGKPRNDEYIEKLLKSLSIWDKKDQQIRNLSGGMKRRVMIAKALSHEPDILFLDEPTAGVDVELRKSMWEQVHELRNSGVTIILTTHYIEEAEQMADRIGVINNGQITLTESKDALMKKMGKKQMVFVLRESLEKIPKPLKSYDLVVSECQNKMIFTYDTQRDNNDITELLDKLKDNNIHPKDIYSRQSRLEDIFIQLVEK